MNEDQTTPSSTSLDSLVAAWRAAASDLGIRVVSSCDVPSVGTIVTFPLHLPDFGGPSGMVCTTTDMPSGYALAAKQAGYYFSSLSLEAYSHYDRSHFIDTLNDWKYFGPPEQKPLWYSSIPWGHDSTPIPNDRNA